MLRELCGSSLPFAGKVVVMTGDLRQIAPVVENAGEYNIVRAMLCSSPLWQQLVHTELQRPVRDAEDPSYSEWVDSLGDGTAPLLPEPNDTGLPNSVTPLPPTVDRTIDLDDLLSFVYPNWSDLLGNPDEYVKNAILCTTNHAVCEINDMIVDELSKIMPSPGCVTFYSRDRSDSDGRPMAGDVIDRISRTKEAPPHKI